MRIVPEGRHHGKQYRRPTAPTPTPTPSSLTSASNGRDREMPPVTSRSTNTMVNTIDRASVDEDSTSSSLAIR